MKTKNLKQISVVAVFSAIAFLLTFLFKFKVSFLTFDFKDAVIAIVSLTFGSAYGVASAGIVAFLEFLSISDTGLYGLIMNFISSGTFALIIGSVYKHKRTLQGAILSAILSAVGATTVMMLANYFITPYYMGVSRSDVLALIPTLLLPFNLAKTVINAASTLILYKPLTNALKRVGVLQGKSTESHIFNKKSLILMVVALLVIVTAILFVIFYLNGGFKFIALNG